ncbi:hypothetical protein ACW9I8_04505 [Pseudomonas reactans]
MLKFTFAVAVSAIALFCQVASAMNGQELSQMFESKMNGFAENYMDGLADGFKMRDALRAKPSRYEYCKPYSVKLDSNDYRAILDTQLRDPTKQKYITYLPAYLVILIGMNERFPCSE